MPITIRGKTSLSGRTYLRPLSNYSVDRYDPKTVADFSGVYNNDIEYYRSQGKTTSFSDMFTHVRDSNATMVDSDGLLKWAPHNLFLNSEDVTAWDSLSANLVESNGAEDPDGGNKGISLVENTNTGSHEVGYVSLLGATVDETRTHTFEVYVKRLSGSRNLQVQTQSDANAEQWTFDLTAITATLTYGSSFGYTASIEDVGAGWFRCVMAKGAAVSGTFRCLIRVASGTSDTYSGDGVSGLAIAFPRIYYSDLGGMVNNPDRGDSYVPTTSSPVYLPRRNHYGWNGSSYVNKGLLLETETRTNLFPNSNDLLSTIGLVETLNSGASPSGENDAILLSNSAAGAGIYHYYKEGLSLTQSTQYTLSCYVKYQAGSGWVWLLGETSGDKFAYFNVNTGAKGTTTNFDSTTIENCSNGWYRISVTFTKTSASASEEIGIGLTTQDAVPNWDSTGVADQEQVLVYGFQLEVGSTPSSYIPTTGAATDRLAETLTIPAAKMAWPTPNVIGPELVTNGTFDTDTTGWTASVSTLSAPSNELVITSDGAVGNKSAYQIISGLVSGKVYQVSVDAIALNSLSSSLRVGDGVNQSQYASRSLSDGATNTVNFVAQGTSHYLTVLFYDNTGDVSKSITLDNISVKEIDPLSVSLQMQGEMTYADTGAASVLTFFDWQLDLSNRIYSDLDTDGASTGEYNTHQAALGLVYRVVGPETTYSPDLNVPYNIASRHGSTFINGAVDGTALTADTTPPALPDLSTTNFQLGYDYMGTVALFREDSNDWGDSGIQKAST